MKAVFRAADGVGYPTTLRAGVELKGIRVEGGSAETKVRALPEGTGRGEFDVWGNRHGWRWDGFNQGFAREQTIAGFGRVHPTNPTLHQRLWKIASFGIEPLGSWYRFKMVTSGM